MQVECRYVKITIYFPYQSFSFTFIAISKLNLQCTFRLAGWAKILKSDLSRQDGQVREDCWEVCTFVCPFVCVCEVCVTLHGSERQGNLNCHQCKTIHNPVSLLCILKTFCFSSFSFILTLISRDLRSHHNINVPYFQLIEDKDAELFLKIKYLKCTKISVAWSS